MEAFLVVWGCGKKERAKSRPRPWNGCQLDQVARAGEVCCEWQAQEWEQSFSSLLCLCCQRQVLSQSELAVYQTGDGEYLQTEKLVHWDMMEPVPESLYKMLEEEFLSERGGLEELLGSCCCSFSLWNAIAK